MLAWRSLAIGITLLSFSAAVQAQTYALQEKNSTGKYFHVHMEMNLKGKLNIQQQDKAITLDQQASAQHDYVDRVLEQGEHGLIQKTARYYQTAKADITVDKNNSKRKLREELALQVAQRTKDGLVVFSPREKMTREELDMTEHFDSLALPGLLPGKEVAIGETWKLHNAAAQGLCYFEGLTTHDLTGKLEAVKDKKATLSLTGTAGGIYAGAAVKLKIQATAIFDLDAGRVVSLNWNQQDSREQGPASPALTAEVNVKLTRQPVQPVNELSDFALVPVPRTAVPPPAMTVLSYQDQKNRYKLSHDRAWMLVARTEQHLVLRLLDRGDFVAQVSITNWPKAEAGKHLDEKEFKEAMSETIGWQQQEVLEAKEVKANQAGYWIYRLAASGQLNGQNTVQYFYLVAAPSGEQMVLAFTMSPTQVQKLGTRDLDLVQSLVIGGK